MFSAIKNILKTIKHKNIQKIFSSFNENALYFNTGSLGICSQAVTAKVFDTWNKIEQNPTMQVWGHFAREVEIVREKIANFVNASKEEIFFSQSATEGMNTLVQGINFRAGDRVLISSDEHSGVLRCWEYCEKRYGIKIDRVNFRSAQDKKEIIQLLEKQITAETKVICLSHVFYTTGFLMPVEEISKIASEKAIIFIIDGAQACGVQEINLKKINCSAYVTSGHKWLGGPKGTGFLYLNKEARSKIFSINLYGSSENVSIDFKGVPAIPSLIGLGVAIKAIEKIGLAKIQARILYLSEILYKGLLEIKEIKLLSKEPEKQAASLIAFELPARHLSSTFVATLYLKERITLRSIDQLGIVRISIDYSHSEKDVRKLLKSIKQYL